MGETFQFDLVSPERKLASLEASEVQIPASEGDFTAMANHSPFMTTLRPGVLSITSADGTSEYVVTGGFVEVSEAGTSVLAEEALPKSEVTEELLSQMAADADAEVEKAADKDAATKRAADFRAITL